MSLSNKELLDKIKDQVAREAEFKNWLDVPPETEGLFIEEIAEFFATEKAKELLPKEKKEPVVESSEPQEPTDKDYFKCPSCGDKIRYGLNEQTREAFRKSKLFAPVESQEEKMSHWQYQQFAEAAITQLKEKNEQLQSENKLLREEIERLKTELNSANAALDNISERGNA